MPKRVRVDARKIVASRIATRKRVRRVHTRRAHDKWFQPLRLGSIRVVIQIAALLTLLHFNATHFDSGEVKTLAGASLVSVVLEAIGLRRNG